MTTVGYVHHSGRFDRTPDQLGESLVAQARVAGVNVIGVTEVAATRRKAGMDRHLDAIGWAVAEDADSECALAYDKAAWQLLHVSEVVVSHVRTWSTKGRLRAPFKALLVSLRSLVDGRTYTFSVAHTPSHVATRKHWYGSNRARQHRDGLRGWHQALARWGKRHPAGGGRVVSMDLNMDVAQAWVRRYVRRAFPGLRLVADRRYTDTHDSRTIDVVLVSRSLNPLRWFRGKRIRVVRAKDSDHRSIITKLRRR